MLFRGPPFASSSASVFCWRGFFLGSPPPVALLAGSLRSASPVLFSVSGLGALVPVVQVCLQAASVFCLVHGSLSVALSGAPGFQSFFSFSSAQISLSLSQPFLLQPLAPGVLLIRACFCLGYFGGLDCPSPSHGGLPIGIPVFLSGSLPVALSHPPGGVRLFASLDVLPVHSSGLSGAFVALPGSLLCILPGFGSLSSQFPVVGLVLCFLPCGPAPGLFSLWPVGCFPVSNVTLRSCVLSWSLGFSIPWQFSSSWAPLSRFSYSTASSSMVLAVASGSCLLIL